MPERYKNSIARILRNHDNHPVGAGVLAGTRQVLTCAHVVNAALGREDLFKAPPSQDARIPLDFPAPAPDVRLVAKIVDWLAPEEHGEGDIALLELETEAPEGTQVAGFVSCSSYLDLRFRAFGFPNGHPLGLPATGFLGERRGGGRVMLEKETITRTFVAKGYSGTGVWCPDLNGLAGIVVWGDFRDLEKTAFLIPADQLQAFWPDLPVAAVPYTPPEQTGRRYTEAPKPRIPKPLTAKIPRLAPDKIIGRQAELEDLHQRLFNNKQVVLVNGLGGIGKTTLAQVYTDHYWQEYQHVAWISQAPEDVVSVFVTTEGLLASLNIAG